MFGRVDGMRSRMELMQVLDEQRVYVVSLEEGTSKFKNALKDADASLDAEKKRSLEKDKIIENQELEIKRLAFAMHNSEQEIARLQFLLDNITTIHPGTMKRINNMPYNQKFPDRAITKYAKMRYTSDGPEKPTDPDAPVKDTSTDRTQSEELKDDDNNNSMSKRSRKSKDILEDDDDYSDDSDDDTVSAKGNEKKTNVTPNVEIVSSLSADEIEVLQRYNWVSNIINTDVLRQDKKKEAGENSGQIINFVEKLKNLSSADEIIKEEEMINKNKETQGDDEIPKEELDAVNLKLFF